MSDLNLQTFNKLYPMVIHKYNDLFVDQNATVTDKINSIIDYLNSVGKLTNDVVKDWNTVYQWVMNDGLTTDVNNKIEAMNANGELNSILTTLFNTEIGDLTALQTTAKNNVVAAINENQTNIASNAASLAQMTQGRYSATHFGAVGDGVADDRAAIQSGITWINANAPGSTLYFDDGKTFLLKSMTDSTNRYIFTLSNSVNFDGFGTLKIGNSFGAYEVIFQASGSISNVTFKNITIDGNFSNNAFTAQPTGSLEARRVFQFTSGDNVTFDNVTIKNVCARHGIITNGITKAIIKNCKIINWGAGSAYSYDSTCVYVQGYDSKVIDNYFQGTGSEAVTCIELHGQRQHMKGNLISQFQTGVIVCGQDNLSTKNIVSNNIFDGCINSILLWGNPYDITNLTITNNEIYVDNPWNIASSQGSGIGVSGSSTCNLKNVTITNNVIQFNQSGTFVARSGLYNAGISINTFLQATNVTIQGNIIEYAPNIGIGWGITNGSNGGKSTNILIRDNEIRQPGLAGYNAQSGIWLNANDYFAGMVIRDNLIVDDRSTPIMQYGVMVTSSQTTGDNSPTGLRITSNKVIGQVLQSVYAANCPYVESIDKNWTINGGVGSAGWAYGSKVFDTAKSLEYTQITAGQGKTWDASSHGMATLNSGATTVNINHNLGVIPNVMIATPMANVGAYWISAANATYFVFNCASSPVANTTIMWKADIN